MNMRDICKLKYKDIGKEFFSFIRNKTRDKTKGQIIVTVPITEEITRIMKKWGNRDKSPENYVFPFLTEGLTEKQIQYKVRHRVEKINQGLELICKELGIERKLTSYVAKHSDYCFRLETSKLQR